MRQAKNVVYPEQFSKRLDCFSPSADVRRQTYLLASTPRCGSHFLGHALQETNHFGVPLEYLSRGNVKSWAERLGFDGDEQALFDAIRKRRTSASGWFGYKAHWGQFAPFVRHGRTDVLGPISKVVFIYRRDILGQAISYARAKQTGAWISGATEMRKAVYKRDLILRCIKSIRRQNRLWRSYLTRHVEIPVMSVAYEKLVADAEGELSKIGHFIDPSYDAMLRAAERTKRQSDTLSNEWRERFESEIGPREKRMLRKQSLDLHRAEVEVDQRATL